MREKINIGGKIIINTVTTKSDVKRQMQELKDKGMLRVKISDYKKVFDYLIKRRKKNQDVEINETKIDIYKKLKNDFIKALTEKLGEEEKKVGVYKQLKVQEWRKKGILKMLNYKTDGGFSEYADFDDKNRGHFVVFNVLLLDTNRKLAILQAFQYLQWKSNEHSTSRKNYYVIGLTEEGRVFTHPINGQIAWKLQDEFLWDKDWFLSFLRWAFKYKNISEIILQGDVGLIKISDSIKFKHKDVTELKINSSHILKGNMAKYIGLDIVRVYDNATLIHTRRQHDTKLVPAGCYKFGVMREGALWDFSKRIKD